MEIAEQQLNFGSRQAIITTAIHVCTFVWWLISLLHYRCGCPSRRLRSSFVILECILLLLQRAQYDGTWEDHAAQRARLTHGHTLQPQDPLCIHSPFLSCRYDNVTIQKILPTTKLPGCWPPPDFTTKDHSRGSIRLADSFGTR